MKGSNMKKFVLPLAFTFTLVACVSEDESTTPVPPLSSTFKAMYVPAGGVFPFPNDLFLSGSTDGTLNIAVADPNDNGDYLVAMNALDGWSTTAPIFVPFNGALDGASITAASVRVVNVTGAPAPLTFGTHFTATVSTATDGTSQLMITPVAPLNPKSRYAFIITRGITSGGTAAVADTTMQAMLDVHTAGAPVPPELAPLYTTAGLGNVMTLANGLGVPDANIAVVFTVTTQSTSDVLAQVNTAITAAAAPNAIPGNGGSFLTATGQTNKQMLDPGSTNPNIVPVADIYTGFLTIPMYSNRTQVATGRWLTTTGDDPTRYTAALAVPLAVTETIRVPMLASVPNAASGCVKPGSGWPVVIFQHGIGQNRTNLLPLAQAAALGFPGTTAAPCFAIIAVDHALHGLPSGHPLYGPALGTAISTTIYEQTFDADVTNNTTRAPGADGLTDASGQNFINLSSLVTSRDNLRQSAVNLIRLAKSVGTFDYNADLVPDFDASRVHFAGHSLGGIVGTTFLGVNTNVQAATLAMPGGTIARLLRDSPTFSASINAGLAANGVVNGTQLYEQFMQAAQTVVDSGDPINFAAAANAGHAIHLMQVNGDAVVPNSATARLIAAMGLTKRSGAAAHAEGYAVFTAGDHGSILNPTASLAATVEMQMEFASWLISNGATFTIVNPAVIEP